MRRLLYLFILLSLFNLNATHGQNKNKIDSLQLIIQDNVGLEKYDHMIALVRELFLNDYNESLLIAKDAYQLAKQHSDSIKMVESGRICGQLLNYLDRSNEAMHILTTVLPTAERNKLIKDYKLILENLAIAHTFKAEYDKALNLNLKVLVLKENEKNNEDIAHSYGNIGLIYYKMKNFNEALTYFLKALKLQSNSTDRYGIEGILINIGLTYKNLKDYKQALEYFTKAFDECGGNCHDQIKVDGHYGKGVSYFELKEYVDATAHLTLSYQLSKKIKNKRYTAENLAYLAKIDINQNKSAQALNHLKEVEDIAKSEGYNELLIVAYQDFAMIYDEQGEHEKASFYLKKYVNLKDSIYTEDRIANLAKIKSDYEQRENLAIIKAREMTIEQQRKLNLSIMIVAILSGLLILVLQQTTRTTRRVNTKLSEAKSVILEQNRFLQMKNRDLDLKVEKKTEELKRANLSLKEMNDELDNFIHRTSQEIRSPLASLNGICNVALMDIEDENALVYLNKINGTTSLLNSILKRLLVINKINNSNISITQIDFETLIHDLIDLQKKKGIPSHISIRKNIHPDAILYSDKEIISIVLENLVDYVIRFCTSSTRESYIIEINVAPAKNGRICISIIDDSIRFDESENRHRFEMFLDSERAEKESADLYFGKTAAAKVGGRISTRKTEEGFNELSVIFLPAPIKTDVYEKHKPVLFS